MVTERGADPEPRAAILRSSPDRLRRDQRILPSRPSILTRLRRRRMPGRSDPPSAQVVRAPSPAERWNCLFLYAPAAVLDGDQIEILKRVRALTGHLLLVVATPALDRVPQEVAVADALIWKDLSGFDFSAYALALEAVGRWSPGATAYVQNDSVLGPFGDLDALVSGAPWDVTGFIGSPVVEEHFSSFAFVLKEVTSVRVEALASVMSTAASHHDYAHVVMLQETRLARIAAQSMTVGSLWYLADRPAEPFLLAKMAHYFGIGRAAPVLDARGDATLSFPLALLDQGFPFLKRSLFSKYAGLAPDQALHARLTALGWGRSAWPDQGRAPERAIVTSEAAADERALLKG